MGVNQKYLIIIILLIATAVILLPRNAAAESFKETISKVQHVFIDNWPDIFKTREQNLDSNGDIKVHEQGNVNVNVSNNTPIPVALVSSLSGQPLKWEYDTDCFSSWNSYSVDLPQRLNIRANNGWELVTTLQFQEQLACEYWKRPLAQ